MPLLFYFMLCYATFPVRHHSLPLLCPSDDKGGTPDIR